MANNKQIKLIQTAVKQAGIRTKNQDGRYRLLLGQYKKSDGSPVKSSRDLTNRQLDDLLAVCESLGWRCPGKEQDHFRKKAAASNDQVFASFSQKQAIKHLAGDLGMTDMQRNSFINRMTKHGSMGLSTLSVGHAYNIIEALKAMVSRQDGKKYANVGDVMERDKEVVTDGRKT